MNKNGEKINIGRGDGRQKERLKRERNTYWGENIHVRALLSIFSLTILIIIMKKYIFLFIPIENKVIT